MNNKIQKKKTLNPFTLNFISICLVLSFLLTGCASAKIDNHINKSITLTPENNPEDSKSSIDHNDISDEIPGNNNTDKAFGDDASNDDISEEDNAQSVPSKPITPSLERRINQTLSAMSLKEKVAQIFLITPEALTGYKKVTKTGNVTRNALRTYPVGGLIYFSSNIVTPKQLKTMTTNVQKYAKDIEEMPLFLAIDEEGGTVARIGNNHNFKVKKYSDMASIGVDKDFEGAYEVGNTIGAYLHEYGINLDFAPDADVLTNLSNKVIGNRSFGTDANLVAKMDLEVAKGLADNQISSCFKHFPGHGIVNKYGSKEAVILSIKAGVDMILMPQDFKDAYQAVLDAVANGEISEKRINQSLERILRVKLSMRNEATS